LVFERDFGTSAKLHRTLARFVNLDGHSALSSCVCKFGDQLARFIRRTILETFDQSGDKTGFTPLTTDEFGSKSLKNKELTLFLLFQLDGYRILEIQGDCKDCHSEQQITSNRAVNQRRSILEISIPHCVEIIHTTLGLFLTLFLRLQRVELLIYGGVKSDKRVPVCVRGQSECELGGNLSADSSNEVNLRQLRLVKIVGVFL
jgi:hypothetical protein